MALRDIRGLNIKTFLEVLHYLFVVPLSAVRSLWISKTTGVDLRAISRESCDEGLDLLEAANRLRRIVKSAPRCGVCRSANGEYVLGDDAKIFDRQGWKDATCFNFQCRQSGCLALCGGTTCAIPGPIARHVVNLFID